MTSYVIAHVPYGSPRLLEEHGLIGDPVLLAERASEPYLDTLFTADEKVVFGWSRLCCDVGVYLRNGSIEDLVPKYVDGARIRPDPPPEQIVAATMLAKQHELRLCTQIEHANSLLDVLLLDARSFGESAAGSTLLVPDICLSFNEVEPTAVVLSAAEFFEAAGLCVALNEPIRGCLLPSRYFGHSSTIGMTVALNRNLYLDARCHLDIGRFDMLKTQLSELHDALLGRVASTLPPSMPSLTPGR